MICKLAEQRQGFGDFPNKQNPRPGRGAGSGLCRKCGYTSYACYITSFAPLVALLSEKWHKKSRKPFKNFLLGGAAGGRLVFSFESLGQVYPNKKSLNFIAWILFGQCLLIKVKSPPSIIPLTAPLIWNKYVF